MLIEIYTLNIYARMRKVINFYKMKRKNWKKKFLRGLTISHFHPFPPPYLPFWIYFTYFVILLVITSPILTNFFFSFFLTMLCYQFLVARLINWFSVIYTHIFLYVISSPVNYLYVYLYNLLVYLFVRTF